MRFPRPALFVCILFLMPTALAYNPQEAYDMVKGPGGLGPMDDPIRPYIEFIIMAVTFCVNVQNVASAGTAAGCGTTRDVSLEGPGVEFGVDIPAMIKALIETIEERGQRLVCEGFEIHDQGNLMDIIFDNLENVQCAIKEHEAAW